MSWLDIQPEKSVRRVGLYNCLVLSPQSRDSWRLPNLLSLYSRECESSEKTWSSHLNAELWVTFGMETDKTLIRKPVLFFKYLSGDKNKNYYLFQFRCPNIRKLLFFYGDSVIINSSFVLFHRVHRETTMYWSVLSEEAASMSSE